MLCAYRTADAIYLYVAAADEKAPGGKRSLAYLLDQDMDSVWELLGCLPADKRRDCRK